MQHTKLHQYLSTCAIDSFADLKCWGFNLFGQLGDGTNSNKYTPKTIIMGNIVSIGAGRYHTCMLDSSDDLYCWGYNLFGQVGDATDTNKNTPTLILEDV